MGSEHSKGYTYLNDDKLEKEFIKHLGGTQTAQAGLLVERAGATPHTHIVKGYSFEGQGRKFKFRFEKGKLIGLTNIHDTKFRFEGFATKENCSPKIVFVNYYGKDLYEAIDHSTKNTSIWNVLEFTFDEKNKLSWRDYEAFDNSTQNIKEYKGISHCFDWGTIKIK